MPHHQESLMENSNIFSTEVSEKLMDILFTIFEIGIFEVLAYRNIMYLINRASSIHLFAFCFLLERSS